MPATMIPGTHSDRPPQPRGQHILNRPSARLEERGDYPGAVRPVSLYTQAALHRNVITAGLFGAGLAAALWRRSRQR